ncbi:MAG: hypothetical protein PW999_09760 [Paraburkholderia tropica]|nr:hypothetical protein [Paraburkholderia tropica]
MQYDEYEEQRKKALREMCERADNTPESQRKRAIEQLGERWIMHPSHAPSKGVYNPITGKRLA